VRKVDASGGRLSSEARGEVEVEDGVLVVRRIHVHYTLSGAAADADVVERVHGFHARRCPIARSIGGAIAITTSFELA
jgi:uncharacterized OsmC-like protein